MMEEGAAAQLPAQVLAALSETAIEELEALYCMLEEESLTARIVFRYEDIDEQRPAGSSIGELEASYDGNGNINGDESTHDEEIREILLSVCIAPILPTEKLSVEISAQEAAFVSRSRLAPGSGRDGGSGTTEDVICRPALGPPPEQGGIPTAQSETETRGKAKGKGKGKGKRRRRKKGAEQEAPINSDGNDQRLAEHMLSEQRVVEADNNVGGRSSVSNLANHDTQEVEMMQRLDLEEDLPGPPGLLMHGYCGSVESLPDFEIALGFRRTSGPAETEVEGYWVPRSLTCAFLSPTQCAEVVAACALDAQNEAAADLVAADVENSEAVVIPIDPILFVSEVQNNWHSVLGITTTLDLPQGLAFQLLENDERKKQAVYRQTPQECPICCTVKAGKDFFSLPSCAHRCCRACLVNLVKVHVNDGALDHIRCMVCPPANAEPFDTTLVREILLGDVETESTFDVLVESGRSSSCDEAAINQALLDKFEAMTLSRALDGMTDIAYCPRCADQKPKPETVACIIQEDNYCECEKCRLQFCAKCLDVYHPDRAFCEVAPSRAQILSNQGQAAQNRVAEAKSLMLINQTSRKCPTCSFAIQKISGCNKMKCENCRTVFCWQCLKVIDSYDHFRSDNPKSCVLFDQDAIRQWNEEVARLGQAGLQRALQDGAQYVDQNLYERVRCAVCRVVVVRWLDNPNHVNNHLRCPYCRQHSCLYCRRQISCKPVTAHFQPRGNCPQFERT
ncbi:unnamed protein product [Amoebophrya sp. A120]|nr:unnamed protein product [Amoebophrya sp. A120]|eukprot:GSA120T00004774001.1